MSDLKEKFLEAHRKHGLDAAMKVLNKSDARIEDENTSAISDAEADDIPQTLDPKAIYVKWNNWKKPGSR